MVEKTCRAAKKLYERNLDFFGVKKNFFSVNHHEKFFFLKFFFPFKNHRFTSHLKSLSRKIWKKNSLWALGCDRTKFGPNFGYFFQVAAENHPVISGSWNSTHSFQWSICLKSHRCCIKVWKRLGAQCSCLGKSFC